MHASKAPWPLHGVGGEAVGNVQHNVPVFEWELEGRVALVDYEKTWQVYVWMKRL